MTDKHATREKQGTRLRDELENDILTGKLMVGERLDEVSLARRFGVSRTPIREALLQLSSTGLVEVRPHRGAVVAALGPARLLEMFEVMAELEAMCGRLAARRLDSADERALLAAHEACREAEHAGDPDTYYYENEHFHMAIYAASRNGFLEEQARTLHRRLKPYRRLQLHVRDRMYSSFEEHEAIVAAIREGRADEAARLLRSHVAIQGERFGDLVANLPKLEVEGV